MHAGEAVAEALREEGVRKVYRVPGSHIHPIYDGLSRVESLPTAIVAKMEQPHRDVVALAGDGAFLMTIGDLPTAAEYGANVLMIVLNDGAFGQTLMQQTSIYGHTYGTSFVSPNFAQIAKACGAEGIRVTDPQESKARCDKDSPRRSRDRL